MIVIVKFRKFISSIVLVQFKINVFSFVHSNQSLYPELPNRSCKYSLSCIFACILFDFLSVPKFSFLAKFCTSNLLILYFPSFKIISNEPLSVEDYSSCTGSLGYIVLRLFALQLANTSA